MPNTKDAEIQSRYEDYSVEELREALNAIFDSTDDYSDSDVEQMDAIMAVLNKKNPLPRRYTAEESWKHFQENYREELSRLGVRNTGEVMEETQVADADVVRMVPEKEKARPVRHRKLMRFGLVAAAVIVLFIAAAATASALGYNLFGWVPKWNDEAFSFGGEEAKPNELSDSSPIAVALEQLGIHEPLYPTWLPEGFKLKTSIIQTDPVFLHESYFNGDRCLTITIEPSSSAHTYTYQKEDESPLEYYSNNILFYIVSDVDQYTAIWQSDNYAAYIMGNITLEEMKQIIDSVSEVKG